MKIMAADPALLSPQGTRGLGETPPKENFDSVLSQMVNKVNQMQQESDQKISGTLMGNEDLHEAMLSLEKANIGLKLLLQVRNKLVSAYEELSRMNI
jgi:flagellar hook-basal body complex protein FliE